MSTFQVRSFHLPVGAALSEGRAVAERAKHTAGPWKVLDLPDTDGYGLEIVMDDDLDCQVVKVYTEGTSVEQATADAYLIAAAPEMLKALQVAHYQATNRERPSTERLELLVEYVERAIRLATGKEEIVQPEDRTWRAGRRILVTTPGFPEAVVKLRNPLQGCPGYWEAEEEGSSRVYLAREGSPHEQILPSDSHPDPSCHPA